MAHCTFSVDVLDNEAPSVACPASQHFVTSYDGKGDSFASFLFASPIFATDNADSDLTVLLESNGATTTQDAQLVRIQDTGMGTFAVGTSDVTVLAIDDAGKTAQCTFTVQVTDDEVPTITSCPGPQTEVTSTGGTGDWLATVTFTAVSATDNADTD
eukprot:447375-Rhodomonas_salina.1